MRRAYQLHRLLCELNWKQYVVVYLYGSFIQLIDIYVLVYKKLLTYNSLSLCNAGNNYI